MGLIEAGREILGPPSCLLLASLPSTPSTTPPGRFLGTQFENHRTRSTWIR